MKFTLSNISEKFFFGDDVLAPWGFRLVSDRTARIFHNEYAFETMVVSPDSDVVFSGTYTGSYSGMVEDLVIAFYNCAIEWKAGKKIAYNAGVTTFPQWLRENIDNPNLEDPYAGQLGTPEQVFLLYRKEMIEKYRKS